MRILVTGFDAFHHETINPAEMIVKNLPESINGVDIDRLIIPTIRFKAVEAIKECLAKHTYDAIICLGQAGGRSHITLERVAINCDDFSIDDNEGNHPKNEKQVEDGPDAYLLTLPIEKIKNHLIEKEIPVMISNTAGTFVCNHVAYGVAHYIHQQNLNCMSGFIHIPYLPSQVLDKPNQPSMSLSLSYQAIEEALYVMIEVLS